MQLVVFEGYEDYKIAHIYIIVFYNCVTRLNNMSNLNSQSTSALEAWVYYEHLQNLLCHVMVSLFYFLINYSLFLFISNGQSCFCNLTNCGYDNIIKTKYISLRSYTSFNQGYISEHTWLCILLQTYYILIKTPTYNVVYYHKNDMFYMFYLFKNEVFNINRNKN